VKSLSQLWILHATALTCKARHVHLYSSGKNIVGLASCFLIGFENSSMIDTVNLVINLWLETSQALAQNVLLMFY
ncbi:hypothetical protein ACQP3J_27450, partial [Escherichia coli]